MDTALSNANARTAVTIYFENNFKIDKKKFRSEVILGNGIEVENSASGGMQQRDFKKTFPTTRTQGPENFEKK